MAAISVVRICNMALSYIGATPIEDIGEDSKEAAECRLWYDYSRLQALRAYNWAFARKRLTLAAHGDDPPNEWAFRYQYPSDCVAARWIVNPLLGTGRNSPILFNNLDRDVRELNTDAIPFEVEMSTDTTKSILTNECCPELLYTFDQESPAYFSPGFVDAVSLLMASRMAFAITGKRSLAKDATEGYIRTLRAVGAVDATEAVAPPPREAEWVRGR